MAPVAGSSSSSRSRAPSEVLPGEHGVHGVGQPPRLGGLAAALAALEGDEPAPVAGHPDFFAAFLAAAFLAAPFFTTRRVVCFTAAVPVRLAAFFVVFFAAF